MLGDSTNGCQACVQTFGKQVSFPVEFRCRKRGFSNNEKGVREPGFSRRSGPPECGTSIQLLPKTLSSSSSRNSGSTKAEAFNDSALPMSGSTKNSLAERSVKVSNLALAKHQARIAGRNGVGTRHSSEHSATILETKADPGDYGRLMFVTRSLNCRVLPAIG